MAFNTRNKNIKLNVVQCYAPTNGAEDGKKEEFYEQLQILLNKLRHNLPHGRLQCEDRC